MNRLLLVLSIVVPLMFGCTPTPEKQCYDRPAFVVGHPDPLTLEPVDGTLVYPEGHPEQAEVIVDLNSFQNILLNNKKVENYIRECTSRIDACEAYHNTPPSE